MESADPETESFFSLSHQFISALISCGLHFREESVFKCSEFLDIFIRTNAGKRICDNTPTVNVNGALFSFPTRTADLRPFSF
jgi:hypothetical protein